MALVQKMQSEFHLVKRLAISIFKTMATDSEKILRRAAHLCFKYRGEVYIWGGYIEHHSKVSFQQNDTFLRM